MDQRRWIGVASVRCQPPGRGAHPTVERERGRGAQHPQHKGEGKSQNGHAHARHTRAHAGLTGRDGTHGRRHRRTCHLVDGCSRNLMARRRDGGSAGMLQHYRVRGGIHPPSMGVQSMHPHDPGQEDEQATKPQGAPRRVPRPFPNAHRVQCMKRLGRPSQGCRPFLTVEDFAPDPGRDLGACQRAVPARGLGWLGACRSAVAHRRNETGSSMATTVRKPWRRTTSTLLAGSTSAMTPAVVVPTGRPL